LSEGTVKISGCGSSEKWDGGRQPRGEEPVEVKGLGV